MIPRRHLLRPQSLRLFHTTRRILSSAPPLIRIQDGTFYQNYPTPDDAATGVNPPLFPNLSFTLPSNEVQHEDQSKGQAKQHWAVIGSTGRTTLLDILRGQYVCVPPTARSYPYLLTDEIANKDTRLRFVGNAVQYIGFSGEGSEAIGGTRGAYLSARYESLREETDWTVRQYLRGQMSLNPLDGEEQGKVKDEQLLERVITDLRLGPLLDMPVANLSNGQTRRARIAKALLSKPELLLLDDPFMGLDPATTRSISGLLQSLAAKSDPRLILALRPQDSIPDWITHVMVLGNSNQVLLQCPKEEAGQAFETWWNVLDKKRMRPAEKATDLVQKTKKAVEAGHLDSQVMWDLGLVPSQAGQLDLKGSRGGEPLIEMDGVRVQYGDKTVLGGWKQKVNGKMQDGLHWTVRRGQRWVVLGPNGSGKTTLLSLITSDHPQAYALPIKILGRSRLPEPGKPAISLFELQSRLGHSSPEIHAFFPRQLSVRQAVESAFAETFLSKPKLDHERDLDVSAALRFFKAELDPHAAVTLNENPPTVDQETKKFFPQLMQRGSSNYIPTDYDVEYADKATFGQLNTAQQRLILFIRALIHKPDIVILDEAFSGMPASIRDKCIHFLEVGEHGRSKRHSTITRRTNCHDDWLSGFNVGESEIRHNGLSDQQALVMISHNREEIPDSVRHYMRLPPDQGDDPSQLDFRFGVLKYESTLNDPKFWDVAWAPPEMFQQQARRSHRRKKELAQEEVLDEDEEFYEWYSM